MRLRTRSPLRLGQEVDALMILPMERRLHRVPIVVVEGVTLSVAATLAAYDIVEASVEERQLLKQCGFPLKA